MNQFLVLNKKNLSEFVKNIANKQKVVAPVKKGVKNFAFQEVTSGDDVCLDYIPTILPPKKYFMPQRETLVEYNIKDEKWKTVVSQDNIVLFGVHTCDLAGIQCLNMAMTGKPKDINYIVRQKNISIIGFECNDYCDEYASCKVVKNHLPKGGYDLFLTDIGDEYLVHVNTLTGENLVEKAKVCTPATDEYMEKLKSLRAEKKKKFKEEVNVDYDGLKPLFDKAMESKIWEDIDKKCVACGNCTNVCPTCYCFDVIDEPNLDLNTGKRYRVWDSCQNEGFAKVAGNENFREERGLRQRHRYMRKFSYPVGKFSKYFCTGCGRCSRTCMAKINLKETINALAEENK